MIKNQNSDNLNLINEFKYETKVRLLADKMRVAGLSARIAEDHFDEYIGLVAKKEYVEDRVARAERVLSDMESYAQKFEIGQETVEAYQDYILNAGALDEERNSLVEKFYRESKYKTANDEMVDALREFEVAVNHNSLSHHKAKLQMAKSLFSLPNQDSEVLHNLANEFVKDNVCGQLISHLKIKSISGEAKWKKYGALVLGESKISPYCNAKLNRQDYVFSAGDALAEIQGFVAQHLQQTTQKDKKKKVIGFSGLKHIITAIVK